MKKTLYLMRHAQTLFNLQHRIQGWCDSPLSELEMRQRMADTLHDIMEQPDHNVVLAVSHGGSSFGFLRYWQNNQKCTFERPKGGMPNCTIYEYEYEDGQFSLVGVHFPDFTGLTV